MQESASVRTVEVQNGKALGDLKNLGCAISPTFDLRGRDSILDRVTFVDSSIDLSFRFIQNLFVLRPEGLD
jgi:hypothetical protein